MSIKYAVIFEKAENNWAAYVPDLPGCITTGATLEQTEANIREAIIGHLETLRQFGEPVPEPASLVKEVEVTVSGVGRPLPSPAITNHEIARFRTPASPESPLSQQSPWHGLAGGPGPPYTKT